MEVAVIIALAMEDWLDGGIIIGILLLNAIVGWYQEKQAADVVASLKGDIAMKARVVRDGQETEIRARELVPGDVVSSSRSLLELNREANYVRLSLKKAVSLRVTLVLSANTTTPTDRLSTKRNFQLKMSHRRARRNLKKLMRRELPMWATRSLLSTRVLSLVNPLLLKST